MPSVATRRWDTKAPSTLKRNTPGRWPIEQPHTCPPQGVHSIQMLRLTPRNHDGQYVARWRIDVSTDCRLDQHEDAFGNITHVFTAEGPFTELAVAVEGEV